VTLGVLAIGGFAAWVWRADHPWVAVAGAPALLALLWMLARHAQAKVQMAWLMRSASVILQQARGRLPALEERLDFFASRLVELADRPDADEVLVVGHSSGAMLAVSVMARALAREPALLEKRACVGLLTLGHCIPVLSYQPEATRFREELARMRQVPQLTWLDFTAPPDGCCFALVDPTEVCLDGQPEGLKDLAAGPKRLSPRFAQAFSPAGYRLVRRDRYRCHFQYLMATELPAAYDYFSVTAGPMRLVDRFAGQSSVTGFREFQCFGGPRR
jgi:pimeloyl-ACP methyl ester carboxylesterase